jgi:hypothetical protein
MLIKAVLLFLLVMVAIALLSNVVAPGSVRRIIRRNNPLAGFRPCPKCGKDRADCRCGGG